MQVEVWGGYRDGETLDVDPEPDGRAPEFCWCVPFRHRHDPPDWTRSLRDPSPRGPAVRPEQYRRERLMVLMDDGKLVEKVVYVPASFNLAPLWGGS